jgi:hypothetical protein
MRPGVCFFDHFWLNIDESALSGGANANAFKKHVRQRHVVGGFQADAKRNLVRRQNIRGPDLDFDGLGQVERAEPYEPP